MNKEYKSVKILSEPQMFEEIGALVSLYEIDALMESDEALIVYYGDQIDEPAFKAHLDKLATKFGFKHNYERIPFTNWNKDWEAGFKPIYVDDFVCVHADFHNDLKQTTHKIEINPKMSFGTGHHETSYMMMAAMRNLDLENTAVLDLGCGTSVLAILAEKLKAASVYAIDYDELCFTNSEENIKANHCQKIELALGTLAEVPLQKFDLILANINRGVLMSIASDLHDQLKPGAQLLISGILETDQELVLQNYKAASFKLERINQKGDWLCILFAAV